MFILACAWKQQLPTAASFVSACMHVCVCVRPFSSPSEGRTHIPALLPDSGPGRRSAGADKWQGPQPPLGPLPHLPLAAVTPPAAWLSAQTCRSGILPSAPTSNPPHPPSFSEVGVFKEIACFLAAHLFCLHMVTVKLETSRRMRSRFHGHARQLLTRQTESGFRCHQVLTGFVTSDCTVRAAGAVLAALDRVWFQLFFFFLCDSSVKASRVRRGYGRMENSKRRQAMRERGVVVTLVSANSGKCVCVCEQTRTGTQTHMCVFVGHGIDF